MKYSPFIIYQEQTNQIKELGNVMFSGYCFGKNNHAVRFSLYLKQKFQSCADSGSMTSLYLFVFTEQDC